MGSSPPAPPTITPRTPPLLPEQVRCRANDGFGAGAVISPRGDIVCRPERPGSSGRRIAAIGFSPRATRPHYHHRRVHPQPHRPSRDVTRRWSVSQLPFRQAPERIFLAAAPPGVGQDVFTIGAPGVRDCDKSDKRRSRMPRGMWQANLLGGGPGRKGNPHDHGNRSVLRGFMLRIGAANGGAQRGQKPSAGQGMQCKRS